MSSLLKNKIKLVLLNYLLSAKSRWFSLREEGIVGICDQTLPHTDNGGVRARMHVDADAQPRTRKQTDQRNSEGKSTKQHSQRHACAHLNSHTRTHR